MVRIALAAALLMAAAACQRAQVGSACVEDSDCGRGFDCSRHRCVQVCTSSEDCTLGGECVRHRCQRSGEPHDAPANIVTTPPPAPDPVAAELRAIRVELETVRREQQRLTELVEALGAARSTSTPTSAGPRPPDSDAKQARPEKRVGIR